MIQLRLRGYCSVDHLAETSLMIESPLVLLAAILARAENYRLWHQAKMSLYLRVSQGSNVCYAKVGGYVYNYPPLNLINP